MYISYASQSWNKNSAAVDTAYLIMREKASGKIVQILLEETEPDSSQFTGKFSVSLTDKENYPELFVPPPELRGTDKDNKQIYDLLKANKLPRKPLIWKKNEKGHALMDVYDTREQAEAALSAYQQQQKLAQELRKKKPLKGMTNETAVAAVQADERKAQMNKLAMDASKRTSERVRMEQLERQRAEERERIERLLSESERAKHRAQAAKLNAQALALYNQGNFPAAEVKFKQAVDMDPENREYYFKYGVTLYRNQKFNEALVSLTLAKVNPASELEKKYFMGLVHYRLSELDNASALFDEVGKSNDPVMAPSAIFYQGVIQFAQEKYEDAKKAFEQVIDISKDPNLDNQAEEMLEKIAAAMAFQKMRENKWTVMGNLGLMYDSNVLLSPDNNQGSGAPTNSPDTRLVTLVDLQYRPVFTERHEWTPHVSVNLTNSQKNASAKADPYMYTLAMPYSYKGKMFNKGYKMTANPGYDLLYMDPSGTGTKTQQLSSYYLSLDNTFVMNKDWVSLYTFEYRTEKSYDPSSVGPADLSGNKYTLRTTQTLFVDASRKQALMPALGYIRTAANGSTKASTRFDVGVTFVRPLVWETSWNLGLLYYQLKYPGTTPARTDSDVTLSTGLSKPLKEWVIWGVTASYTKNTSTDVNSEYTKYLVMTTATFMTNF